MQNTITQQLTQCRNVILSGSEVIPHFHIVTGEGNYEFFVQLPEDIKQREWRFSLMARFMVWKLAHTFAFTSELIEPDAISSVSVSHDGCMGALQRITREPLGFGDIEWADEDQVADEIKALLPPKEAELSAEQLGELQELFQALRPGDPCVIKAAK